MIKKSLPFYLLKKCNKFNKDKKLIKQIMNKNYLNTMKNYMIFFKDI